MKRMASYGSKDETDELLPSRIIPTDERTLAFVNQNQKKTAKSRRRPPLTKNKAANKSVLNQIFTTKSDSTMTCSERTVHSWLYIMLNPRSSQIQAVYFKMFIVSIIIIDLIFFIFSTDPQFKNLTDTLFHKAEGVTSSIFLLEYVARLYTVIESRYYKDLGPIYGRLKYMITPGAIIDALATFPFFIELATGLSLPTLTYIRVFRLLRILKTEAYARAFDALWRVFYYNSEILKVAGLLVVFLIVFTAVLMYYMRPPGDDPEFSSIAATMYIATLLLTGQGGPDADNLPWYTRGVILMTGAFSVAVFAIPASMLTWGFEAEAERLAAATRRKKKTSYVSSSSSEWDSSDGNSTDEEYQRIIAGEGDEDEGPSDDQKIKELLKVFRLADTDQSGSLKADEFVKYLKENMESVSEVVTGPVGDGLVGVGGRRHNKAPGEHDNLRPRVKKLEEKVDEMNAKLDLLLDAIKQK